MVQLPRESARAREVETQQICVTFNNGARDEVIFSGDFDEVKSREFFFVFSTPSFQFFQFIPF